MAFAFGGDRFPIIAGPCVIESEEHVVFMAERLAELGNNLGIELIFKSSFDKANRTSGESYRGIGLEAALPIFSGIRAQTGLPVLTDVHHPEQPAQLQGAVDVLQIPAFLCRQTDLLGAAAATGLAVNVKKGQFLSPWEVGAIIAKLQNAGSSSFAITERGTSFGYNNLVSDMRAIPIMQEQGAFVIFDASHSAQLPGAHGNATGGLRKYIPALARAAVAAGCDGLFIEVHDRPEQALSDAATQWPLDRLEPLLRELLDLRRVYLEHRNGG